MLTMHPAPLAEAKISFSAQTGTWRLQETSTWELSATGQVSPGCYRTSLHELSPCWGPQIATGTLCSKQVRNIHRESEKWVQKSIALHDTALYP